MRYNVKNTHNAYPTVGLSGWVDGWGGWVGAGRKGRETDADLQTDNIVAMRHNLNKTHIGFKRIMPLFKHHGQSSATIFGNFFLTSSKRTKIINNVHNIET